MPASALNTMGAVTASTRKVAVEVLTGVENAGHRINTIWGFNPGSVPEHSVGRALDFMCNRAAGDWIAEYLWNNRARFGVKWILWRQRIRSTSPGKPGTWQPMANRGNATVNHMDHVHVFLNGRDPGGASAPAPKPAPAAPAPRPPGVIAWDGTRDDRVTEAGRILVDNGFGRHYRQGPGPVFTDAADGRGLVEFTRSGLGIFDPAYVANVLTDGNLSDLRRWRRPALWWEFLNEGWPLEVRLFKYNAICKGILDEGPWSWNDDTNGLSDLIAKYQRWIGDSGAAADGKIGPKQFERSARESGGLYTMRGQR